MVFDLHHGHRCVRFKIHITMNPHEGYSVEDLRSVSICYTLTWMKRCVYIAQNRMWDTGAIVMMNLHACGGSKWRIVKTMTSGEFYKIFAYMMLARVEPTLEIHQPEEQHGFRKGHRIEEHLLTANLVEDKLLAVSAPIWIVSLDLSKAFDRVNWDKLWVALEAHGVSDHLVWTMQNLYTGQLGQTQGDTGDSCVFPITAGVRQGCVLNPKLFTATLQWGHAKMEAKGGKFCMWY